MVRRRMLRIAMVAPLTESVPPPLYGGTERVVSGLTEELVRRGHDVTLFASGDSVTGARLAPCCPRGLRLDPDVRDPMAYARMQLGAVYERADEFDVIHNHVDSAAFPFARVSETPTITTAHGRLDLAEIRRCYELFREQHVISISNAQRTPLPRASWVATVHNGIDLSHFRFNPMAGTYLVFLGRINPQKRPDRAIEIARELGMPLVMAAKVDPTDRDYYEHAIAPMIEDTPLVDYIGEVNEQEKDTLLGGAYAYLFPIDWPEPFGLTMVESMATGTPVIAYRAGSVPEVVTHGVTGYVCETVREMIDAVPLAASLDRSACRAAVEQQFSVQAMADGYERAYWRVLSENGSNLSAVGPRTHSYEPASAAR